MYDKMFREAFTFWDKLSEEESESLLGGSLETEYRRGEVIYCSETECKGIFLVLSGSMRVYIVSEEIGRASCRERVQGGDALSGLWRGELCSHRLMSAGGHSV